MENRRSFILGFISLILVAACLVGVFSMSAFSNAKDTPGDTTQDTNNDGTSGDDNTGNGGTSGDTNTNVPVPSKYQLYNHDSYNSSKVGYRTIGTETWYFAVYENPLKNNGLDEALYDESKWSFTIIEDNVTIYGDMNVIIKYSFDYGISWNTAPLVVDESGKGKTIYHLDNIPANKVVCISYTVVSNDKTPSATMQNLMNYVFTEPVYGPSYDSTTGVTTENSVLVKASGFTVTLYNPTLPDVVVPAG